MNDQIPLGGNRMRLLNVLNAAHDVVESLPVDYEENIQVLKWALEALPDGWQDLMLDEIVE